MNYPSNKLAALAGERKAFAARRPSITVSMPEAEAPAEAPGFLVSFLPTDRVELACTVVAISVCALFAVVVTVFPQQFFDTISRVPALDRFFTPY